MRNINLWKNKKNEFHSDSELQHGSEFKLWKLIYLIIPFSFTMIVLLYNFNLFSSNSFIEVLVNPWWGFTWSTITLIIFYKDVLEPLVIFLKIRKANDVSFLLSIAILTSYIFSVIMMLIFFINPYSIGVESFEQISMFEATIEILTIVYLGYWINEIVNKRVKKSVADTDSLLAKFAYKLVDGKEVKVNTNQIKIGDTLVVKNGMKFATDGVIIDGLTTVNESLLTGESIPAEKKRNSNVFAGTVSQGERVLVKCTKLVGDSMLSSILKNIKETSDQKSNISSLIKKLEYWIVPLILIASLIALVVWSIILGPYSGFKIFATSLIVACPMVFILLIPTTSLFASSIAFKKGIVFNSTNIFVNSTKINAAIFDKTGTLTTGKLDVIETNLTKENLSIVKSMEKVSHHPVASSISDYLAEIPSKKISAREVSGGGVEVTIENKLYKFGNHKFVTSNSKESKEILEKKKKGSLISYLSVNNKIQGYIELRDKVNETSITMIKELKAMNKEIYMITGDTSYSAHYVANKLGIKKENVYYEVNPLEKHSIVKILKEKHKYVSFMGDGINDALALEQSDIGISVHEGTDLARSASSISLLKRNNNLVPYALKLSSQSAWTIRVGFILAITWISAIVLFTTIFLPQISSLLIIGPIFGALSMVFNDLLPVVISSTLYTFKFRKIRHIL